MAGTKEIRARIQSVKNTRKITYAMKLVSAAKLRKAQESVVRSRAYTSALNVLLAELSTELGSSDLTHPLMEPHNETKRVRIVVVGGSRGLCGGYNTNINKRVESIAREFAAKPGVELSWTLIGKKVGEYFRRTKRSYVKSIEDLPEDANLWPVDEICREVEQEFLNGEVDEVYVVFTRFKSALSMTVMNDKLLPMEGSLETAPAAEKHEDAASSGPILFEPSPELVFDALIPRIMRSKVRQAFLDAKASEHSSRMTAMDAATKNAGDLTKRLQLLYNKIRQSGITAQLLDIVGGAEAIQ